MDCPRCATDNEAGRKFCRECGARLSVTCPSCGTVDSSGSKFCGECGTVLAPDAVAAAAPGAQPAPAATAERRLVTVLFADLVGFTSLSEARDPEEMRELLSDYYDLAREVVGRYRGTIEKFIGDAVMAVWGAPVAREDDAERAVRCALDLVHSVAGLAERRQITALTVRAGVHTGEAAVSIGAAGQGLVAGDIVNTAARLQAAAEPGTVVVGDATRRAAARTIAFRRLADLALKGKAEPVAAWLASHLLAPAGAAGRAGELEPPFVGRSDELRLLRELYHATVRERRARLISVMGQAGIGKTRLAWELEKYVTGVADETCWLQGRSPAYDDGLSYWALGEMVRRAAGIVEEEDPASSRQKLAALLDREVPDPTDRQWLEPRLGALVGTDAIPEGDRGELYAAWRMFFERIASGRPLVLVFEDIHWADAGMLDFIEALLQWSRALPILVVTLARPELLDRRPTWGAGQRSFSSVHLDPLPEDDMRQLLAGLVPGLPADITAQVVQRAEGVPLYAVETVRMLIDRGVLAATDDGYHVAHAPAQLSLPETLHALIAARLDALPAAERRLLQDASVLGLTFQRQALVAIEAERPDDGVDQMLASLVAKELLRVEDDPRSPERGQLGFVQGAVREVAYATLGRDDRRVRHVAAARHLAGSDEGDVVGVVASHFLAAYRAAPDHPEAPGLRAQAGEYLVAAAERARALHSYQQALAHLDDALEISDEPAERAAIQERAGEVARLKDDPDAALRYLTAAIEWYRGQSDLTAAARATTTLSTALINAIRIEQAMELITATLDSVKPGDGAAAPLLANMARAYLNRGDDDQTIAWADRAIAAGEVVDDVHAVIEGLISRGSAALGLGRPREAQAILRGALALAERHGVTLSALRAANNLADVESEDAPRDAVALYEAALERSRAAGELSWASNFSATLLQQHYQLGQWQAVLDEVAAMDDQALLPHEWEHLNDLLAMIAAFQGDDARAAELLARWRSDPDRTASQHEAAHQAALGWVALAQGRYSEASRQGALAAQSHAYRLDGHFLIGRAAARLGAQADLSTAIEVFQAEGAHTGLRRAQLTTIEAGLADVRGTDSAALHDQAIRLWLAREDPLQAGLSHLELAARAAAPAAAEAAREEARRLLAPLGAERVLETVRNLAATER